MKYQVGGELQQSSELLWRCKRIKTPGDGGVVDGCGWQGRPVHVQEAPGVGSTVPACPDCGSLVLREVSATDWKLAAQSLAADVQRAESHGRLSERDRPMVAAAQRILALIAAEKETK